MTFPVTLYFAGKIPKEIFSVTFFRFLCYIYGMKVEDFYRRYGNMILSIAYRITGNNADAWDILQDTVLEFEKRKPEGNIKAWAGKVATNKAINLVKKENRIIDPPDIEVDSVERKLEKKEIGKIVNDALLTLSPIERAVVTLKKYENMSHREIARVLEITEENSRVILMRSLKKLKRVLEPLIGGAL